MIYDGNYQGDGITGLMHLFALFSSLFIVFWIIDYIPSVLKKTPDDPIYLVAATKFGAQLLSLFAGTMLASLQFMLIGGLLFLSAGFIDRIFFTYPNEVLISICIDVFFPNQWIPVAFFCLLVHINSTRHMLSNPKEFQNFTKDWHNDNHVSPAEITRRKRNEIDRLKSLPDGYASSFEPEVNFKNTLKRIWYGLRVALVCLAIYYLGKIFLELL